MIRRLLDLPNDDSRKIMFVAISLCLVCSLMVSSAAVFLAPIQIAQEQESLRRNVLIAAGLLDAEDDDANVNQLFRDIEARIVDLDLGEFTDAVNPATFDPEAAARGPASIELRGGQDVAGIGRRERYSRVYVVRDGDEISRLVLPIRGRGLWSTMFAYVALEGDFNTVAAINYFDHGETPGLGEVDDPEWQALWIGRKIYDDAGQPRLKVIRGRVNPASASAIHEIDGMAGATLTGNGVSNTIAFWFGESGFGPFLKNLSEQGA
jgi:Na+-transporting NADH:ubiquinone oxidoreductase subunit C